MEMNDLRQIYIDLRQQLYPLVGDKMRKATDAFEEGKWAICFQSCNSLKIIISSEMNQSEKDFFENITEQLRLFVWASEGRTNSRDAKVRVSKDVATAKLPGLLEKYLQLLFKEMSNQGIWFPKSKKHETFQDLLLEETFGLEPEPSKDKIEELSKKLKVKELLQMLPRQEIEKIYLKEELKHVLQK